MKKITVLVLMSTFLLILGACGGENQETSGEGSSESEETINLKLGTIRTDDAPTTQAAREFANLVNEKSNGEINIEVFPNSQIGGILDMFTGMESGTVDMMYEGISSYSWLEGAKTFNIMSLPFYWESYDQMTKVLNSEEFDPIFDEAAANTGVRVINAVGDTEARQLTASRAVESAADFEGLKIRTAEAKIVQETMRELGAEPVVIPFADLYLALKQGTADAQENGFITVQNNSLFEVQDYLMETNYIRDVKAWYISEGIWSDLSEEHKEIMREASKEAGELQTELANEQIDESLEFLKGKMEYIKPDLESIRKALENLPESFEGDLWPEGTYELVEEIRNS